MAVSAQMVKELREATGAAILDCKKALDQFDGDMDKAKALLAEKGLAAAKKRAGRTASEGIVETYSHTGSRVGVMVEVNCETDFVAKNEKFIALAHEVALHIAFANPKYLDPSEIPADLVDVKKKTFSEEAQASGKPDNIVEKIVEGRMNKFYAEICLLNQPFVKDEDMTVGDLVTQTVGVLKENIKISRFARFEIGGESENDSEAE